MQFGLKVRPDYYYFLLSFSREMVMGRGELGWWFVRLL